MPRLGRERRRAWSPRALAAVVGLLWSFLPSLQAQTPAPSDPEASRIERLERLVGTVVEENRRLAEEVRALKEQLEATRPPTPPAPSPSPPAEVPVASPKPEVEPPRSRFRVDYQNGFSILPDNVEETPFSLRVSTQNVFRYDGFSRSTPYWTDSAGNRLPIANNNNFQIPRGRLIFSGTALLPQLSYLLNIDYNTVTSNPIGFRAYELTYRFSRGFNLSVGQSKVPGSREWMESAFAPLQGADRSMATTFFRPSLSQGVWIKGEPVEGLYYHAMMSNGFNTLNLQPARLNNRFCWSGTSWWEPWGEFGRGYSDLQDHRESAIRVGASYTYAIGRGSQSDSDAVENSPLRLSDGTLITQPGAIAPNVTLQSYDVSLAAFDLAYKYRGLGISTELYFQRFLALVGNGPLPIGTTSAFGGFVQGGYFVVPQTAEIYARASYVTGDYGSGSEIGSGFNWFFLPGKDNLRYTFDAAWLDRSPAGQNRTGFAAGQSGLLIRTQLTVAY